MVVKMETTDLTSEQSTTLSKYAGLEAAITAELTIHSWFGVGVMLAVGIVDGLNHFVRAVTRGK